MYTDPKRLRATDPGETDPENNPLWAFHETFNPDKAWVDEHRETLPHRARSATSPIKSKLVEVLNALIEPIRTRRKQYEQRPDDVIDVLREGTQARERGRGGDAGAGEEGDEAGLLPAGAVAAVRSHSPDDSVGRRRTRSDLTRWYINCARAATVRKPTVRATKRNSTDVPPRISIWV